MFDDLYAIILFVYVAWALVTLAAAGGGVGLARSTQPGAPLASKLGSAVVGFVCCALSALPVAATVAMFDESEPLWVYLYWSGSALLLLCAGLYAIVRAARASAPAPARAPLTAP